MAESATANETSAYEAAALPVFSTLWALHVLWHYTSYLGWFTSPLALLTICASLFLLLEPSSPVRLALSGYLYCVTWFAHTPNTPNHETLGAFVAATFTLTILVDRLSFWRPALPPGRAFVQAVPVIRVVVLVMYFWATFHKLNRDFLFSPKASCGAVFYKAFLDRFTFLTETSGLMHLALAWGTVLIEGAIAVLLLVRRTRNWGIALAWGFHFFLTLNPKSGFYNFTSLLFPLFLVFAPRNFFPQLLELVRPERWRRFVPVVFALLGVAVSFWLLTRFSIGEIVNGLVASARANRPALEKVFFRAWLLWSLPLTAVVWLAMRRAVADRQPMLGSRAMTPKALWAVAALFVLWGATPYLGLKTESSFSMFSNLRTERNSNHLLMPESLKLFSYQDDAVDVVSIKGRRHGGRRLRSPLQRKGYEVPYEGLRGWLRTQMRYGATIDQVSYRRGDELITVPYSPEAELFSQSFWGHKLLQFRRFRPEGPMTCEH